MPIRACDVCANPFDAFLGMNPKDDKVIPGDVFMCAACGVCYVYEEDRSVENAHLMTFDDVAKYRYQEDVLRQIAEFQYIIRSHFKNN